MPLHPGGNGDLHRGSEIGCFIDCHVFFMKRQRYSFCLQNLIILKFEVAQMSIYVIPIEAEFHAVTLYAYLADCSSYGHLKAEKGPFSQKS